MKQASANWVDLRHDAVSVIEALRAHFTGHAYDPHLHNGYLIGVTGQGVQQFYSRRNTASEPFLNGLYAGAGGAA